MHTPMLSTVVPLVYIYFPLLPSIILLMIIPIAFRSMVFFKRWFQEIETLERVAKDKTDEAFGTWYRQCGGICHTIYQNLSGMYIYICLSLSYIYTAFYIILYSILYLYHIYIILYHSICDILPMDI